MNAKGRLVLVATPIGNLGDLSPRAASVLEQADVIAAEDTRRTRKLLTHAGIKSGNRLRAVHAHNEAQQAQVLVDLVRDGATVAYVSDAGMPGISDPGERLVRACVEAGVAVEVVPGPSAALTALVLSGLPTRRFHFEGFLPRKGKERRERLDALASYADSIVLYEAPTRTAATLADLAGVLGAARPAALVRELTKLHEEARRGSLGGLATSASAAEPRGEVVIVVGPRGPDDEVDDEAVDVAVYQALDRGATVRDAAAEVARDLGVTKKRAYDVALTRRGRR